MENKFCEYCGSAMQPDDMFCPACGQQPSEAPPVQPQAPPQAYQSYQQQFPRAPQATAAPANPFTQFSGQMNAGEQHKKTSRRGLIIGIVAMVAGLAAIVAVIYALLGRQHYPPTLVPPAMEDLRRELDSQSEQSGNMTPSSAARVQEQSTSEVRGYGSYEVAGVYELAPTGGGAAERFEIHESGSGLILRMPDEGEIECSYDSAYGVASGLMEYPDGSSALPIISFTRYGGSITMLLDISVTHANGTFETLSYEGAKTDAALSELTGAAPTPIASGSGGAIESAFDEGLSATELLAEFDWFMKGIYDYSEDEGHTYLRLPADMTEISDPASLAGRWKGIIVHDPSKKHGIDVTDIINADLDVADSPTLTFNWYRTIWGNEITPTDDMEASVFTGRWEDDALYASGPGDMRIDFFYELPGDGRQYALGQMTSPDGVPALIALVREP